LRQDIIYRVNDAKARPRLNTVGELFIFATWWGMVSFVGSKRQSCGLIYLLNNTVRENTVNIADFTAICRPRCFKFDVISCELPSWFSHNHKVMKEISKSVAFLQYCLNISGSQYFFCKLISYTNFQNYWFVTMRPKSRNNSGNLQTLSKIPTIVKEPNVCLFLSSLCGYEKIKTSSAFNKHQWQMKSVCKFAQRSRLLFSLNWSN